MPDMTGTSAPASNDEWYTSLLGLAESFRTSNPPNIRLCIHCLEAIFTFKPAARRAARTHLQLGTILFLHTRNMDMARKHFESAWHLSQNIASFDEVKLESASLLAQLHVTEKRPHEAQTLLRKAVEISQQNTYWHVRLLFQLAELLSREQGSAAACNLLGLGSEYAAAKGSAYTKVLFQLSKGMLLLNSKFLADAHAVLSEAGRQIEAWVPANGTQKESLKVFFLVLQVCHFLMAGQVKSVKPSLKAVQQAIQAITSMGADDDSNAQTQPIELFQWLAKEHMCVLVYLVTVMHSMQAGYMDKAQKYTDKALMQIEKLKIVDAHPLLSQLQLMLLENIVMCRLVVGNKTQAIHAMLRACHVCQAQPRLFETHACQLHTLLGLYAMSMNCMEAAEAQFNTALRQDPTPDLATFIQLHLAIVYLRTNRDRDLNMLLERLNPETLQTGSHSLKASAFYVKGLQSFFQTRYTEAKRYLRETLKMANAEDLNRLTSCSLVLLGHIFLSLGNSQEALNMVTPAMQLAGKIPDVHVQLWAAALLKDLYRIFGNRQGEAEGVQLHDSFSQALLKDHFQSSEQAEHKLIHWTDGPCPFHEVELSSIGAPLI